MNNSAISVENILLIVSLLALMSVLASMLSYKFAIPSLLLFLVIGMLAGSEGFGGIYFDDPHLTQFIGTIALIFIIFAGGIDTKWSDVRPVFLPGIVLSTVGVLLTALLIGACAMFVLGGSLLEGLLLGSIVSSTDAAAVFSILRSKHISLKDRLQPLLEFESGSNDPMAVFLTLGFIRILTSEETSIIALLPMFIMDMGIGIAMGIICWRVNVWIINHAKLSHNGLYPALSIALVMFTYSLTTIIKGNGYMAVYVAGLLMNRNEFLHKRVISRFHDGLSWLMQIVMFLTLGLLVYPSRVLGVFGEGVEISLALMFLARPIAVFLCLLPFNFTWREKTLVSWVGLRGAVPIILAVFPLIAGIQRAGLIFNIVFFVVITSILAQGTLIPFVSSILGLKKPLLNRRLSPLEFEKTTGIDADLTEVLVPHGSESVGKEIRELDIPRAALIVLILREDKFIVPSGATVIEEGDILHLLASEKDLETVHKIVTTLRKGEEAETQQV